MKEKLLQEYVDRVGIITLNELAEQTGFAGELLRKPALALVMKKQLFYCRLARGKETLLSLHLLFCLLAVYDEPELLPDAQELFYWLCDHEYADAGQLQAVLAREGEGIFEAAFLELQQKLEVAPVLNEMPEAQEMTDLLPGKAEGLSWVTRDEWLKGIYKAARYGDLEYCLSEIRRLLKNTFTTREIDNLIYHGAL